MLRGTRTKKIVVKIIGVILLLALTFVCSCLYFKCALFVPEPVSYVEYVVQEGDTLWDIAHTSNGYNKVDVREIIQDIIEKSNCSEVVYPGEVIYVPVY